MLKIPFVRFVVTTYVIFWGLFIVIGLSMVLDAPKSLLNLLQIVSAWSSTIAFIILFKRIYPGLRLSVFVKEQFARKLNLSVISIAVMIQIIILVIAPFLSNNLALSFPGIVLLFLAFLDDLVRGPLGEELGWRGYALNELQKKYSPLKSALIIGVLWGGWHTPLWFASGYTGVHLIKYILLFMIGIVSFSIMVTLFYNLNKNLVIPIITHQLFNFSLVLFEGDLLDILEYVMLAYFVVAIVLIVINPKEVLYKKT